MRHSRFRQLFLWLLLLLPSAGLVAAPVVIDFDSLSDGDLVTTQFPGATFSNTVVLSAGISLNEFEFPPASGSNVASDDGGPITIVFSSPVSSFFGYFTYLAPLTLTAFDAGDNQVGSAVSLFSNNLALSGDPGSTPNELLQVNIAGRISRVEIAGDLVGGSFALDDVAFELSASGVSEPGSGLLLLPIAALALNALRHAWRHS